MLCPEGITSLKNFLTSAFFSSAILLLIFYCKTSLTINLIILLSLIIAIYFLLKFLYDEDAFKIAIRAAYLGLVFSLGIYVKLVAPPHISNFGAYMSVMALFHYSEFLSISIVQPKQVSTDSYVINHSPEYIVAAVASWAEFFIESYFFPELKTLQWASGAGVAVCLGGDLLRKTAILTAGSNFNHLIQSEKASDHVLVTHGVYGLCRHPSYVGWFYWSIGTQLILLNPLCVPAYAVASWVFFKGRIYVEEIMLLNFFGQQYCDYQQQVGTGIPFIKGYTV